VWKLAINIFLKRLSQNISEPTNRHVTPLQFGRCVPLFRKTPDRNTVG